jgi:DNA polymerase-1
MGDASDNIPGVPGIGEKTALGYIQKFKSIEKLYENIEDTIIKPKAKEALLEFKDLAFMSRTLATINIDIPLEFNKAEYSIKSFNNV